MLQTLIRLTKKYPTFLAAALILAFIFQGVFLIQDTSPTTDEVAFHMPNGYTYLKTQDYRMSPANPALLREWMTLPWLFVEPTLDLNKSSWEEADSVPFGQEFFYKDNRDKANLLLYSSRAMILFLGVLLGLVIFWWSRRLYGVWGGLISLSIYAFCPSLLAHASIAHTDLGITFFVTLAAYFLWQYLEESKGGSLWGWAFAFGLAAAAKYNALVLGPIFLAVLLWKRGFRTCLKATGLVSVASFFVIWGSYFFEWKPLLAGGVPRIEEKLGYVTAIAKTLSFGNESVVTFLKNAALHFPIPIPSYILGFAGIVRSHQAPYRHYSFGEWTLDPNWYHYLFSFTAKMTIAFLCLLFLRALFFSKSSSDRRHENALILLPVGFLFLMTCFDSTGVGVRYLFPVIPMLIVWVGGLAKVAAASRPWKWAIGLLVLLNFNAALLVFPNYLSYFNAFVGGPQNAHQFVRGSDIDWGQGLKGLRGYMKENEVGEIVLNYFGTADPSFYDIRYRKLTPEEMMAPGNEIYAISIFNLDHTDWSAKTKPTAMVKGSIFIYDFRKPQNASN